jgi:hypothetical protein
MKIPTCAILATLLSVGLLTARADEVDEVQTTLQSLGLDTSITGVRFLDGTGATGIMNVPSFKIGRNVQYSGSRTVRFYLPTSRANAQEEEGKKFIGHVTLNPAWSDTLLIWTPVGEDQYAVAAVPNDLTRFPVDHIRFVNTTDGRLALQIKEGESKIMGPGEDVLIRANGREALYFFTVKEDPHGNNPFLSNVVEMRSGMRRTVFLTFDNATYSGNLGVGPKRFSFFVLTHR